VVEIQTPGRVVFGLPEQGWRLKTRKNEQMLKSMRVVVLVVALLIVALGSLAGCLGIIASLVSSGVDRMIGITGSVALLALAVGLGLALAWQAWQAVNGRESRPFRPKRIWPLALIFLLALAAGQVILTLDLIPALIFPPFHAAVAIIPPAIIVGLAGRSLAGLTRWRDMVLQMSSGAFVATVISFVLEMVAGLSLIAIVAAVVSMQSGGQELLESLLGRLRDPTGLEDPAFLSSLAQSPVVIGLALLTLAGVVPLIEEATKTLGIGLMSYRRPTMAQAFLWGLAGGAGFALTEGLLNTLGGLEGWIVAMLTRIGATILHCFVGGLMGLAWYYLLSERRWVRALGLYAASVSLHGLWNALAGGLTLLSLRAEGGTPVGIEPPWIDMGVFALLAMLVILGLAVTFGLALLTRRVRQRSAVQAQDGVLSGPGCQESAR